MTFQIRHTAQICLQDLQNALDNQTLCGSAGQRSWFQRRILDFNTWAAVSGVFREGMYSLDAKLCLRPDLRMALVSLLQVFDALVSPMAEKSDSWMHEIEDKFSEIVAMTFYLRKSLADTGLWPDEDSAQAATGALSGVGPHLAQSFPGNTNTASERVSRPNKGNVMSKLRIRLDRASLRRNKLFADAQERRARLGVIPKTQNIWPPPKSTQFPPTPLVETKHDKFVCQFCCRDLPVFFSDAYAWR